MQLNYKLNLGGRAFGAQPQNYFESVGYGTVAAKIVPQDAATHQKTDVIVGCKKVYRDLWMSEATKFSERRIGGGGRSGYEARNYSGVDDDSYEHGYEVYVLRTEIFSVENPFGETQFFSAKHITHGWDIPEDWYNNDMQILQCMPTVNTECVLSFPDCEPQHLFVGKKCGQKYAQVGDAQVCVSTLSHRAIPNVMQSCAGENSDYRTIYLQYKFYSEYELLQIKWAKEKGEKPVQLAKSAKTVEFKRLNDNNKVEFQFGNKVIILSNCYDFDAQDSGIVILGKFEANRGAYTYSVSIPDGIKYELK
jgi:hypothetical protein